MAASPDTRSPVTKATSKGMWMMSICRMMKAIRSPLRILPSKVKVCSKEAVIKEIYALPSTFKANRMTPTANIGTSGPPAMSKGHKT